MAHKAVGVHSYVQQIKFGKTAPGAILDHGDSIGEDVTETQVWTSKRGFAGSRHGLQLREAHEVLKSIFANDGYRLRINTPAKFNSVPKLHNRLSVCRLPGALGRAIDATSRDFNVVFARLVVARTS